MKNLLFISLIAALSFANCKAQTFQTWELFDLNFPNGFNNGSDADNFIEYDGKMYFSAWNPTSGNELWVSDGTQAGTYMLMDINVGAGNSNPNQFIVFNDLLFFEADNNTNGEELWVTDGTLAGTQLFKDINPGAADCYLEDLNILDTLLYFGATDGINGYELWRSDGTAAGTSIFYQFVAGSGGGYQGLESVVFNEKLVFMANAGSTGYEPWVTDGTVAGTFLLNNIAAGSTSSNAELFYAVGDSVAIFAASNATYGRELYITDGTVAGTMLLKDIKPGTSSGSPKNFAVIGNKVLFRANDGVNGTELWETDLTAAGTQFFIDINPGSGSSDNGYTNIREEDLYPYNGKLYFSADDGTHGDELWISDGTIAGTFMVEDIFPGTFGCAALYFKGYHNDVFFRGNDDNYHEEFWRTDGTPNGTYRVACDSTNAYPLISAMQFFEFQDALWMDGAFAASAGNELWKYKNGVISITQNSETTSNKLICFPNPTSNLLNLQVTAPNNARYQISDLTGSIIITGTITSSNYTIDINSLKQGIYFLNVDNKVTKFEVKK